MPRIEGTRGSEPPAGFTGEPGTPPVPLRKPSDRHSIARVSNTNKGKPGERNTMIAPWVDVQADLDAINAGQGLADSGKSQVWINGRLWEFYADTGTSYPMSGDGFIPMTQAQFRALRIIAGYNGVNERSEREIGSNPAFTDEDREIARRVWRIREEANQ
ncbi:MAG: hypothetical protein ACR2OE_08800 [Thermomicrobiales bacterium]